MPKTKKGAKIKIDKGLKLPFKEVKPTSEKIKIPVKHKTNSTNSEQVRKEIVTLVKETGKAADNKAEIKFRSGTSIEDEFILRDTPKVVEQKTEPQQTTEAQQPQNKQATEPIQQPVAPPISQEPNDTIANILNSQAVLIAGFMKLNPEAVKLTEDEIKALATMQPNGGIHHQSWVLYFIVAIPSLVAKFFLEKMKSKKQEPVNMDLLIAEMEKQGYRVEKPDILAPWINELRRKGYTVQEPIPFTPSKDVTNEEKLKAV